jgi:hypothetical protein
MSAGQANASAPGDDPDGRRQPGGGARPEEGGVAEGEHTAVGGNEPVTGTGGRASGGDDGLVEPQGAGGAGEAGVAEGEDAASRATSQ